MASFVAQGHPLHLYAYTVPRAVPEGVTLVDARTVLDHKHLFRHRQTGSVSPFSDWFRYRLLFDRGGIWSDADVICLRPLLYDRPEVYAWQEQRSVCGALLGLPPGHPLSAWMLECCEHPNRVLPYDDDAVRWRKWRRKLRGRGRSFIKWDEFGPGGLTKAARHLGYIEKALPFWHFYPIHHTNWHTVFDTSLSDNPGLLAESRALHLWHEMFRSLPGFDKNARFPDSSVFEQLWRRYLDEDN
ncbi:MAG: glycosyltransferase [Gemmatimonadota bacterium]